MPRKTNSFHCPHQQNNPRGQVRSRLPHAFAQSLNGFSSKGRSRNWTTIEVRMKRYPSTEAQPFHSVLGSGQMPPGGVMPLSGQSQWPLTIASVDPSRQPSRSSWNLLVQFESESVIPLFQNLRRIPILPNQVWPPHYDIPGPPWSSLTCCSPPACLPVCLAHNRCLVFTGVNQ